MIDSPNQQNSKKQSDEAEGEYSQSQTQFKFQDSPTDSPLPRDNKDSVMETLDIDDSQILIN